MTEKITWEVMDFGLQEVLVQKSVPVEEVAL
jgi:hypothetical protein